MTARSALPLRQLAWLRAALRETNDLKIRLGISTDYENSWIDDDDETNRLHAYALTDLYYDLLPESRVEVGGVRLAAERDSLWSGIGLGGPFGWATGNMPCMVKAR